MITKKLMKMKKILFLILFSLGLTLHFGSDGISLTTFQEVKGQDKDPNDQMGCWDPSSGQGGGFWSWLGSAVGAVGDAISNVANAISDFFSGEEDGDSGEEFGDETNSSAWFVPSGSPDNFENPADDPMFSPPNFGPDEWEIMDNLNYWYGVYANGGIPPTQDCNGVWGGSAYVGSCGTCIGGSTGINACPADSQRVDTVKPTKIPCDSAANTRGNKLTNIRDSINGLTDVQRLKDSSLTSLHESGVSITKNGNTYGTYNFQTGASNNVNVVTNAPGQNIIIGIHTHNKGTTGSLNPSNSPSPLDLYHLINGQISNPNYISDFVFAYDNTEWAIMIDNPIKASNLIAVIPMDSAAQAPPLNNWSTTFKLSDGTTLYDKWKYWAAYLYQKHHYQKEDIEAYANVLFTALNLDAGIKLYKKVNGQFKELNYQFITDATGKPIDIKITICQ